MTVIAQKTGRPSIQEALGEPAETLNVYIGASMLRRLQQRAHDQRRSVAALVRQALAREYQDDA